MLLASAGPPRDNDGSLPPRSNEYNRAILSRSDSSSLARGIHLSLVSTRARIVFGSSSGSRVRPLSSASQRRTIPMQDNRTTIGGNRKMRKRKRERERERERKREADSAVSLRSSHSPRVIPFPPRFFGSRVYLVHTSRVLEGGPRVARRQRDKYRFSMVATALRSPQPSCAPLARTRSLVLHVRAHPHNRRVASIPRTSYSQSALLRYGAADGCCIHIHIYMKVGE